MGHLEHSECGSVCIALFLEVGEIILRLVCTVYSSPGQEDYFSLGLPCIWGGVGVGVGGPVVPLRCGLLLGLRLHLCVIQETQDSSEHLYKSPWEQLCKMTWRCCELGLGHVRGAAVESYGPGCLFTGLSSDCGGLH